MTRDTMVPATECTCDVCAYRWLSYATKKLPESCRSLACRSREWNGKKQFIRSHVNEIKLPAARKTGRPKTITLIEGDDE